MLRDFGIVPLLTRGISAVQHAMQPSRCPLGSMKRNLGTIVRQLSILAGRVAEAAVKCSKMAHQLTLRYMTLWKGAPNFLQQFLTDYFDE